MDQELGLWVEAAPFRAMLRHLMTSRSLTGREVAAMAGLNPRLVERLLNARNSNEIAAVAGLPPIIGLSGPKIAY